MGTLFSITSLSKNGVSAHVLQRLILGFPFVMPYKVFIENIIFIERGGFCLQSYVDLDFPN